MSKGSKAVTTEDRLAQKADVVDHMVLPERSLGQMSREERREVLYYKKASPISE